ncbi:E3 ubiquitin-protein ligase TRIM15-like [Ciconia maguari]
MFSQPLDISPELEEKFCDFTEKTAVFKEAMEKFQGILEFRLPLTTQMTLDPKTANTELHLLEDCRVMWWGSCEQDLPFNLEMFKSIPACWAPGAAHRVGTAGRRRSTDKACGPSGWPGSQCRGRVGFP